MDLEKRQRELEKLYNDLDQRKLLGIIIELIIENINLKKQLSIHVVSNHVVCDFCGDTGRGRPTLQEPDGIDCDKCSSK